MKKGFIFFTITLLVCYLCFPYLCAEAGVTATVTPKFDEDDLPQGFPHSTFDFDVDIKITGATQYHTITVELTSSKFQGIAANTKTSDFVDIDENAEASLETDLYFDAMDNSSWTVSPDEMTLTYVYSSVNTTIPTLIKVGCRDWAANGHIHVTVSGTTIDITERIPTDVNDNNIADGWEKKYGIYVADVAKAQAKAKADDEMGPYKADAEGNAGNINNHDGDGWTVYDEYRGLYISADAKGKPAITGYIRLNPRKKEVMYTLHESMTDYGLGSLPMEAYGLGSDLETQVHNFTNVDSALFQLSGHDPFTEVYTYDETGRTATPKGDLNDLVGRVNWNSNPGGSATQVPEAKSVWALRIKAEIDRKLSEAWTDRHGEMAIVAPSKWSLAKIYTKNIENDINAHWDRFERKKYFTKKAKENAGGHKADAIKVLTEFTISHEVVHGLGVNHCQHINCIMTELEGGMEHNFDSKGGYYQVQMVANPEPKPADPKKARKWKKYIYDRDANGRVIDLRTPYLSPDHWQHLDVTYDSATPAVSNVTAVTIGFYDADDDDDADDDQAAAPTTPTTLTVTLASSDGVYTASAGDLHTAQATASDVYYGVSWFVADPGTTGRGASVEYDVGDGTATTASLDYTFPSGVSGDYRITAVAYKWSNSAVWDEASYTVTVSLPSSSTSTEASTSTRGTLGSSTTTTVSAGNTAWIEYMTQDGTCYNTIIWYVTPPGASETYGAHIYGYGCVNQAQFSYDIPSDATAGTWTFRLDISLYPDGEYEDTFTITVTD